MKYYSEKLKKLFDTEEDLVKAEEEKDGIGIAKKNYEFALQEYKDALAECEEIQKEADEKMKKLLVPSYEKLHNALSVYRELKRGGYVNWL